MDKLFKEGSLELDVWRSKYQFNEETKDEFFNRMIDGFSRDFQYHEDLSPYGKGRLHNNYVSTLRKYFTDFKYILLGGSVYSGIGTGKPVSLSNCYVTATGDSVSQIFDTAKNMANIYKRRGGNGTDMTPIRPRGATVNNAAKTTTGVIPFMELFSATTNTIGQDGRRGALMLSLDIRHPDSPEFATCKRDTTKITGANISLKTAKDFMEAVEKDEDYLLRWPVDKTFDQEYPTTFEYNKLTSVKHADGTSTYVKKIKAKELWDTIIESNWLSGEPGILFWDEIINYDPASVYESFKAISTNPCGEIPLNDNDACRLIASNVYSLVEDPFTESSRINKELAYKVFYEAEIVADTLVTRELEHVKRIIAIDDDPEFWERVYDIGRRGRRTGTGLTGLGDMFAALGVPYGDPETVEMLMRIKTEAELTASIDLAIVEGSFPEYDANKEYAYDEDLNKFIGANDFYEFLEQEFPEQTERMRKYGRRNISWSTIAPTGTISLMAKVTSGCEPVFMPFYMRRKKINANDDNQRVDYVDEVGVSWQEYPVLHPKFELWYDIVCRGENGVSADRLTKEALQSAFEKSPWYGQTANDLTPERRVKTQAILQKYTSHSISSTVNLPNDVPIEIVDSIYKNAYHSKLKGITTYRDGSRSGVLVSGNAEPKKVQERPEIIECKVMRFRNEKKNWVAFIGIIEGRPYEIFTGVNDIDAFPIPSAITDGHIIKVTKEGEPSRYDFRYVDNYGYTNTLGGLNRIFNKEYWNYARLTSALLREDIEMEDLIHIIFKLEFKNKSMNTWQAGVIRALSSFVKDGTKDKNPCPECGENALVYQEGCLSCQSCGFSKCG